jgi:hypothetical protein
VRFSYYTEGANPERASRPPEGSSFFTVSASAEEGRAPPSAAFVPADDPALYYVGRFPASGRSAPDFVWQGSELLARFAGRRLGLRFDKPVGPAFFNVLVDGANRILELKSEGAADYILDADLGPGEHELVLYKRTEAFIGSVAFRGLILERGASLGPRPEPLPLRLEFYGDSITAGACNDEPGEDQYEDQSAHDNYLSYGAIASRSLGAEHVSIAVSGTGICRSWNPILMNAIWDKASCDSEGGPNRNWDFSCHEPDIVVINVGQNDHSLPFSLGQPFPPDFAPRYVDFVLSLRRAYHGAAIVCSIGGMSAWRDSPDLQTAWERAVAELKASDPRVFDLRFEAFSYNHPRVAVHRALAAELAAFIRTNVLPR